MLNRFYKNKKILITGHTGFKGIWLTNILIYFGAKVYGISKNDENIKNFEKCCKTNNVKSYFFNILNKKKLNKIIKYIEPEIIFHLAAQSIVGTSYKYPETTFETNFNGTLNILSISTKLKKLQSIVIVTSDKCYQNLNKKNYFIETDPLGGDDPYSASKGASEILFNSYLKSFFYKKKIGAATARAGNVIGGGDWAKDRIIPDCVRCIAQDKKIAIRNPNSTRPWQHVLDVVNGYLILAQMLFKNKKKYSGNWNFGPNNKKNLNVRNLVKLFLQYTEKKNNFYLLKKNKKITENKFLNLSSSKAKKLLKWKNKYNISMSLKLSAEWYNNFIDNKPYKDIMTEQIKKFFIIK